MKSKQHHILVVDDEEDLCEILQFNLEGEGFRVSVCYSAEEAIKMDLTGFDLFILDVMMGNMSGFRLAEYIHRDLKINKPIIFLTAKDSENDIITGFTLGADDYLSKPFSIRELIARIKAVLKRTEPEDHKIDLPSIVMDGLELDLVKKRLLIDGTKKELTPKEFEILLLMMSNQGKIFSREDILERIWREDVIVNERTIDVNIARIRKKLGHYGLHLKNKTGYGYYFENE